MVNCKLTKNYLIERARMTKCDEYDCRISCVDCPLSENNNGKAIDCMSLETFYPNWAIEIVQKWSDEHPQKTMKDKFFEIFPNAMRSPDDSPYICCKNLGWCDICPTDKNGERMRCKDCWNRLYEEK